MDKIKTVFKLETKGLGFLAGSDIKIDFTEEGQTYAQGLQALREFYSDSLLEEGAKYKGKPLQKKEALSPLAENMIVEKWLDMIDRRLRLHIMRTRGHLITAERPNLCDIQNILCEQMDTLLSELDAIGGPSISRTGFSTQDDFRDMTNYTTQGGAEPIISRAGWSGQVGARRTPAFTNARQRGQGNFGGGSRGAQSGYGGGPRGAQGGGVRQVPPGRLAYGVRQGLRCPPDTCLRCYDAGRFGPASQNHRAADCPYQRQPPAMRVLFLPPSQQYGTQAPQIQEVQLHPDLMHQSQPGGYGGQGEEGHDGYDDEMEDEMPGFMNSYVNKNPYYYTDLSIHKVNPPENQPTIRLVPTRTIQKFTFLNQGKQAVLSIDSGSEGDCMLETEASRLNLKILPLDKEDKVPRQADGISPLEVVGVVKTTFARGPNILHFHGYVVKTLSQPILCGTPFICRNKIVQHMHKRLMMIGDNVVLEDPPFYPGNNLPFTVQQSSIPAQNILSKIEIGDSVPQGIRQRLDAIHATHKIVFDGDLTGGYNGESGDFDVNFDFNNDMPPPAHKGTTPSYYKQDDEMVLQAKIEELERQNVVAKVSDLGINVKYASPCMLARKASAKHINKEDYNKLPLEEKTKLDRFVLCLNKMCNFINKKPALSSNIQDTINLVGSFEYVITADLQDSFNQRWIKDVKLPYMGFHSPYGDNYIFLRSPQGLINQSEELETLVKVVLLEGVKAGHVKVHADNIYVMGRTYGETVSRWEEVLDNLERNNLKLSPKKTACFPNKLDLLGWTKEGKFLIPDPHRQNTLLTAAKPTNVKEMRSFLGTYHTFYKCQANQNTLLAPLTKTISNNPPGGQKIRWTPELEQVFRKAQEAASQLDKLYVPKPEDQLVMTQDYAQKGTNMEAGISATLWARLSENDWNIVARMSAELQPQQRNLDPCDGEAVASFVAGRSPSFRIPILASTKKTLSLVDSKPLMEAANLLKNGKFSSSRLINNVLTSISELNLEFHHLSGKMFKNCPDDFTSRNPAACSNPNSCKIHSFISECTKMTVASINLSVSLPMAAIIGQVQQGGVLQDILAGKTRLPLENKEAMLFLQGRDRDLRRVKELLLAGQRPSLKRDIKGVKVFFRSDVKTSIDKDGCLVVIKRNKSSLVTRTLLVIPNAISLGLLYSLHINLDHPTKEQLYRAVDTRFFTQDLANKCARVVDSCTLCTSTSTIPKEVHSYKANIVPNHPGQSFTVDIMRDCSKFVMVAADNFSGFISTTFIKSESAEELKDGIIRTVTPFMASSLNRIRVDRAPGFGKLANQKQALAAIGIDIELGDAKNKNAIAIVDQKIKELRSALKKICPRSDILNQLCLAKATTTVNEIIRHHSLSAKEIQFSRDLATTKNLQLVDEDIAERITDHRDQKNEEKADSGKLKKAKPAEAKTGQLVFLKKEGDKKSRRDIYMVLEANPRDSTLYICKMRDVLSNKVTSLVPHDDRYRYRVQQTDVMLAPDQPTIVTHAQPTILDQQQQGLHAQQQWLHQAPESEDAWEEDIYEEEENYANHTVEENQEESDEEEELWFTGRESAEEATPQDPIQGLLHQEVHDLMGELQQQHQEGPHHELGPHEVQDLQAAALDHQGHNEDYQDIIFSNEEEAEGEGNLATSEGDDFDQENDDSENSEVPSEEQAEDLASQDDQVAGAQGGNVDQGYEADHDEYQDPTQTQIMNQPRQPVAGDVIVFWDERKDEWVTAKIREKVRGYRHYYNVDLLDGGEDGLYCLPPTASNVEQWSLLANYQWDPLPREQLLDIPEQIPSRQVTPDSTPPQPRQEEQYQCHQMDDLQLELLPDQQLQPGRVHVLPHLEGVHFTPLEGHSVDMEKYKRRVTEIAAGLGGFSPGQTYQRYRRANWVARTEQYTKQHSAYTRFKNVFKKQ